MNTDAVPDIVVSLAGHDKGKLYAVSAADGRYVYLSDGKARKLGNPKKKNVKHIKKLSASPISYNIVKGEIRDGEIRKMLAAAGKTDKTEEGTQLGKR